MSITFAVQKRGVELTVHMWDVLTEDYLKRIRKGNTKLRINLNLIAWLLVRGTFYFKTQKNFHKNC